MKPLPMISQKILGEKSAIKIRIISKILKKITKYCSFFWDIFSKKLKINKLKKIDI